jgi:hypothetical protein
MMGHGEMGAGGRGVRRAGVLRTGRAGCCRLGHDGAGCVCEMGQTTLNQDR